MTNIWHCSCGFKASHSFQHGSEEIVAAPWWIDNQRAPLRKSAPVLGEGNDYVLGFLLNWTIEDRAQIMAFDQEKRNDKKH